MLQLSIPAALLIALISTGARGEAPIGTVMRLTPEQIAAIENAKLKRATAAEAAAQSATIEDVTKTPRRSLPIHGEAGFAVGTGGYTAFFGTVVTPLGDDGFAAFSFETQNYGRNRRRR
jgi:hypothetical protein